MPILRVFDMVDGVRDYVVCSEQLIVGRDSSRVDICIADISVSRVHFKLFLRDGFYFVEDMGSSCGTLVNNKEVKTRKIYYGDHIQAGSTVIEFLEKPDKGLTDALKQTDTVDELMTQYRALPSKMLLSYRVLRITSRSLYKPGDTIVVGRGGILANIQLASQDINYVLELQITWPDGVSKIFLGEIVATIKKFNLVCIKLHHISEDKLDHILNKMERGCWNRVSTE